MRLTIIAVVLLGLATPAVAQQAPEYVKPGMYPNYRVMFQGEMFKRSRDRDFADCAGLFLVANVAPADLAQLDRYARGEIAYPTADMKRVDDMLTAKMVDGNPRETLRPYCPDKADGFRLPAN